MIRLLPIFIALLIAYPAIGATCDSNANGDWTTAGTWTNCGGGFPGEDDDAVIGAHDVVIDSQGIIADSVVLTETSSKISCSSGGTLTILDYTSAVTDQDFFTSEYNGLSGNSGLVRTAPKDTLAAAAALSAGDNDHILLQRGGHYDFSGGLTLTTGDTYASFGTTLTNISAAQSIEYDSRPLWRLDATDEIDHSTAADTTILHTEIACGDVLTAQPIMDRTTCTAPCSIEFKLDVDHTRLSGHAPRVWEAPGATPTEAHSGEDWIIPVTVWDFGDPGSGNWEQGWAATGTTPWSKNMERPWPVAFHVYEKPGRYVATSTTSYDGQTVINSIPIIITSPEALWNDAATFCFADITGNGGGYQGCPHDRDNDGLCSDETPDHSANCVDTTDWDVAVLTTGDCDDSPNRCLFRRGDTFESSATFTADNSDYMISDFGDPALAKPHVDLTTSADWLHLAGDRGVISHFSVTGDGATNSQKGLFYISASNSVLCDGNEIDNTLLWDLEFDDLGNGINLGSGDTGGTTAGHVMGCWNSNVVIYEVTQKNAHFDTDCTDSCGVDLFLSGDSGAVLGGTFGDRQDNEHNVRAKSITDWVLAHGDYGNMNSAYTGVGCGVAGSSKHVITIRNGLGRGRDVAGITGDELGSNYTQRFGITDVFLGPCDNNSNTIDIQGTSNTADQEESFLSYGLWGNGIVGLNHPGTASQTMIDAAGKDVLIANNDFYGDFSGSNSATVISLGHGKVGTRCSGGTEDGAECGATACTDGGGTCVETWAANQPARGRVYDNSAYFRSQSTSTTFLSIATEHENAMYANNLIYDLNTSTIYSNSGTGTIRCEGGATTCNQTETSNPFAGTFPTDPPTKDLFLLSGSYGPSNAIATADKANQIDILGNCRDGAAGPWEGSHEIGGTECIGADNTDTNTLNSPASVGVNLQRNEEFQSSMPWANAMKMAREWQDDNADTCDFDEDGDYDGDVDDLGYPLDGLDGSVCVWTQIYNDTHASQQWEGGTWSLLFDGTATPVVGGAASSLSGSAGAYTFTVDETTTGGVKIGFSALTSLSNMRVYPPGGVCAASATAPYGGFQPWSYCDDTGSQTLVTEDTCGGDYASCVSIEDAAENGGLVFHPLFVKRNQKYRTIRTMDWLRANNVADITSGDTTVAIRDQRDWVPFDSYSYNYNNRPFVTPFGHNASGNVPPEVAIAFCDVVGAECWINVPHFASDAEIERLGRICRDTTELACLFELSNETWNEGSFEQGQDISAAADAAYGSCSTGTAACRDAWVGNRTGEMCDLLEAVFDETGEDSRMVCILGTQGSSTTVTDNRIDCDCGGGGCGAGAPTCDWTNLDGLAIALYFGVDPGDGAGGNAGDCDEVSPATVAGLCSTGGANSMASYIAARITGASDWITAQSDELASQSLGSVGIYVYEGGTNYADTTSNGGICLDVQEDACINTQYTSALDGYLDHDTVDSEEIRTFVTFTSHSTYAAGDDANASSMGNRGDWTGDQSAWPKEDAILDWSAANPCWWSGCELRASEGGIVTVLGPWHVGP